MEQTTVLDSSRDAGGLGRSLRLFRLLPALAGVLLGGVFLLAAAAKGADLDLFAEQVGSYGIVTGPLARAVAWALVPLEAVLGMALLVGWRRRAAAVATGALLLLFIGVSGWALYTGKTAGCGCFGALSSRGPADVIKEDLLMLGLAALAFLPWSGGSSEGGLRATRPPGAAVGWRAGLVAFAGIAGILYMFTAPSLPIDNWVTAVRPGAPIAPLALGDAVPGNGPVLVALMDLDDDGIAATTRALNALATAPDSPKTVAFTDADEIRRGEYFWAHGPQFEVKELARDSIRRMARKLPRVFLARDGVVVNTWNELPPTPDELAAALARDLQTGIRQ